jgi:hypothetical protein
MRRIFFIWAYFLFILFGQENPIQSFYDLINQGHTIKMNVEFLQKQYDNSFGTEGSFYLIGKKKYIFDSNAFRLIANDSLITTINHETKQVIYSSNIDGQANILDILSGSKKYIKFSEESDNSFWYISNFKIPDLGYFGSFEFEPNTGALKIIKLNIDNNQNVSIKIKSIEMMKEHSMPDININKFEIIDLRG